MVFRAASRSRPRPASVRAVLVRENGWEPKKPLWADSGEGWADSMIVCRDVSMRVFFLRAWLPQRMNTTRWSLASTARITWSVKTSQPRPWCEAACPARTVRVVLSSRTPCLAHDSRLPWPGGSMPRSAWSSLWMLTNDGGIATPCCTEKHRPWAWRGPWYGSWPRISTRVSAYGVRCRAANTSSGAGYTVWRCRSVARTAATPASTAWRTPRAARGSSRSWPSPAIVAVARTVHPDRWSTGAGAGC